MTTTYLSCAETAKLVRAALKSNFPGVRFSVRSSTYAGGASIDVAWIDGPRTKEVDAVVGIYQGADFDGMIDLKTHRDPLLMAGEGGALREVRVGADYIHSHREYSVELFTFTAQKVAEYWSFDLGGIEIHESESYRFKGRMVARGFKGDDWKRLRVPNAGDKELSWLVWRELEKDPGSMW